MGSQMKWMSIALLVLMALFGLNSFQQSKYNASSDQIFDLERDNIFAFEIIKGQEFVLLLFDGENWSIDSHDSLTVKPNTINSFLNTISLPSFTLYYVFLCFSYYQTDMF